jgi:hypothetical protein
VSSPKTEQRRVTFRGRDFHFVSYEAHPGNKRQGEPAMPPTWYLMGQARRWAVMPHVPGQPVEELDLALVAWLKAHGVGRPPEPAR